MADAAAPAPAAKPQKAKKEKKAAPKAEDAGPLEMQPPPSFLQDRLDLFDRLKARQDEEIAKKPREPIQITMPDGAVKEGTSWETTPGEIALAISKSLYKKTVVARLDGDDEKLWDLDRPLEASCKLELLDFNDPKGKMVFWHSSAHVLGEACERRFGCSLCIGPPIDSGFYYEMALPDGAAVQETDWKPLETIVSKVAKEKQKFERLVMTKEELLDMFKYNKYKQHIIKDKIPDGTSTTVYRNGPLIDLCRGPHVPDTGRIEAFSILKNSASYFLGNQENDSLQRVYGVSFPDKKLMAEHKKMLEEAAKRDHRKIGKDQELFFFDPVSPGSAFWLPHGARIYSSIQAYLKKEYRKRGYEEVITPNLFNADLWKQSGHWQHYKDDMFIQKIDDVDFGLKPMNCPSHFVMFGHRERSHRELPLRLADFGVLHRNEASGALSGLTRVRRFQQDDAHIFCRQDQIKQEMDNIFEFLQEFYRILGLKFKLHLSTRPEGFMGEIETWDKAEASLKESLDEFTKKNDMKWELNPGDGAFYGPKIDIKVVDSLNREWQCATAQLDFVQPENFSLEYMTPEGAQAKALEKQEKDAAAAKADPTPVAAEPSTAKEAPRATKKPLTTGCARPVVIHRAMAGSIERFTGILCEHFGGKWPFWLSPRQIMVIPVGKGFYDYAEEVKRIFWAEDMWIDVDFSGETLPKKIRRAQLAQYNFVFVVGDEEMKNRQVNIRYRDDTDTQSRGSPVALDEAIEKLVKLKNDHGIYNPFPASKAEAKELPVQQKKKE
ncbi:threonyl-tRNA synthetase [Cryphonectria parasitica EP155]|uniref:threonine--tRNA ligase n=1 Tax=Cryphonectria parasitica (strain ATCC 38755 / EP155) TaxID=660469 RepID=A0A9P5CMU4_CRYP1|nr:threonyl-tRNA synthetase [Cryphonectria parasitica EP155]KAF3763622.1 threonyl-tRNA synthetase [Cryphonectria parasitica EP155]